MTRGARVFLLVPLSPCPLVSSNSGMQLLPIVQIVYWLSLSTWFGGVLFIALAAPVIFRVVREQKPMLPTVLSVNLENQHADLLAGSVLASLLNMLGRIQVFCAAGTLLALLGQWFYVRNAEHSVFIQMIVRTGLFVAAALLVAYDRLVIWPRMNRHREQYLDHADEPEVANPAKDEFDRYQRENVLVLMILVSVLGGMVLFSWSTPSGTTTVEFNHPLVTR